MNGKLPSSARLYQMMPVEQEAVDQFVEDELKAGKIRKSKLPYASPCFFIAKKDGSCRLVQDYWKINAFMVKDKTPLPHIDNLLDILEDGKLLTKMDKDDKWRSVAFILHTMTDAELNYDIYNKELLAIMYALKEWCPFLLDACETFEIWTDHKNLSYFRKVQDLNSQQACWYLKLQDFDDTLPWNIKI